MSNTNQIIPEGQIEQNILLIRNHKVMVDADLARLYGVTTKALNQAVKRNQDRFPADFVFLLTIDEKKEVVTVCDHLEKIKYSNRLPYVFTEHGAIMLANVLRSLKAIQASIAVVRAFIKLRELLNSNKTLAQKLTELESKITTHDRSIRSLFDTIHQLMAPPKSNQRKIGFL